MGTDEEEGPQRQFHITLQHIDQRTAGYERLRRGFNRMEVPTKNRVNIDYQYTCIARSKYGPKDALYRATRYGLPAFMVAHAVIRFTTSGGRRGAVEVAKIQSVVARDSTWRQASCKALVVGGMTYVIPSANEGIKVTAMYQAGITLKSQGVRKRHHGCTADLRSNRRHTAGMEPSASERPLEHAVNHQAKACILCQYSARYHTPQNHYSYIPPTQLR